MRFACSVGTELLCPDLSELYIQALTLNSLADPPNTTATQRHCIAKKQKHALFGRSCY